MKKRSSKTSPTTPPRSSSPSRPTHEQSAAAAAAPPPSPEPPSPADDEVEEVGSSRREDIDELGVIALLDRREVELRELRQRFAQAEEAARAAALGGEGGGARGGRVAEHAGDHRVSELEVLAGGALAAAADDVAHRREQILQAEGDGRADGFGVPVALEHEVGRVAAQSVHGGGDLAPHHRRFAAEEDPLEPREQRRLGAQRAQRRRLRARAADDELQRLAHDGDVERGVALDGGRRGLRCARAVESRREKRRGRSRRRRRRAATTSTNVISVVVKSAPRATAAIAPPRSVENVRVAHGGRQSADGAAEGGVSSRLGGVGSAAARAGVAEQQVGEDAERRTTHGLRCEPRGVEQRDAGRRE